MSTIIIQVPLGSSVYNVYNSTSTFIRTPSPFPSNQTFPTSSVALFASGTSPTTTFTLYFPYTPPPVPAPTPTAVDISQLATSLIGGTGGFTGIPAYAVGSATVSPIPVDSPTFTCVPGSWTAVYVPYIAAVPAIFDAASAFANLSAFSSAAASAQPSSPTSAAATSVNSTQTTTPPTTAPNNATPINTTNASSPANPTSSSASPTANTVSRTTFDGAIAGGVVGAFLLGLIVAFLVAACFFRRRKSTHARGELTTLYANDSPKGDVSSKAEELSTFRSAPSSTNVVTGWQKHLPQEKDDRTIAQAFKSIFGQVEVYTDGFYRAKSGDSKPSKDILAPSLKRLAPPDLLSALRRTTDPVPVLEAILLRWILPRISLRSPPDESLLPQEMTRLPDANDWNMETDVPAESQAAELKSGFLPAFSQWRVLTNFLYRNSAADLHFQQTLAAKIDRDAQTLSEAFAAYARPGSKDADRVESLRKLLQQASEAGMLLFSQPSTFAFDWSDNGAKETSSGGSSVMVSPALVRRFDGAARGRRPVEVLVKARKVNV